MTDDTPESPAQEEKSEAELLAEWEAMAAEDAGDDDQDAAEADAAAEDPAAAATDQPVSQGAEMDSAIHQVELEAYAILGTATMPVSQLLRMGRGAVVELGTTVGDQIELRINNLPVATGDVVVVEDRIAMEISEIVKRVET